MLKERNSDWYKNIWSLDIKNQSWVEDTENQVNFIIKTLELTGNERILDLACGFGRHSLSFAKKGYSVVGVDITKDYIEDARITAQKDNLNAEFIHADIRDINFSGEFDVVLNLADGAIGYLENDDENLKIFDKISEALKPKGKHFMDICNAEHAEMFFPKRGWEIGEKALSLSLFEWNKDKSKLLGYTVGRFMKTDTPVPDGMDYFDISDTFIAKGWLDKEDGGIEGLVKNAIEQQGEYTAASWKFTAEIEAKDAFGYYIACDKK